MRLWRRVEGLELRHGLMFQTHSRWRGNIWAEDSEHTRTAKCPSLIRKKSEDDMTICDVVLLSRLLRVDLKPWMESAYFVVQYRAHLQRVAG